MRRFLCNVEASAIGFIISMVVIAILVTSLIGTVALYLDNAATNTTVAGNATHTGIPGGPAMLYIIGLLFIVVPVIIFAKAAK